MNLLTDQWIPVRLLDGGTPHKLSLRELLCGEEKWELCLPRDDMELAAMQLLICLTQALLTPKDLAELRNRVVKPISGSEYDSAVKPFAEWFVLNHPKQPFMQIRGVKAKFITPMDKLFAGLTGSENCCFVNEQNLVAHLCGGCSAIALFNQASCSPSFGGGRDGGFKNGLRGGSPVTTLIQGPHLRQTIWGNVLNEEDLNNCIPWYSDTKMQKTTWIEPIKAKENIAAQQIGLLRGLFWQPAHIELTHGGTASCSCCGEIVTHAYNGFYKEQFGFNVEGTWPHPHSPRIYTSNGGETEERFMSFRASVPAWTQLSRYIVQQKIDTSNTQGQEPATVVLQAKKLFRSESGKLHLNVGGYRTNKATVLERCHNVFSLNNGWDSNPLAVRQFVSEALGYRDALYRSLYLFVHGIKGSDNGGVELKGALRGKDKEKDRLKIYLRDCDSSAPKDKKCRLYLQAEGLFFRRSEPAIEETLARIDFSDPAPHLERMRTALKAIANDLFNEAVQPYLYDPELIKTLAIARRTLLNHLKNMEPQQDKGGNDGTTKTP